MKVRTRFAPSPTGHVHIGNMRAAIYNWLLLVIRGAHFFCGLKTPIVKGLRRKR